MGLTHHATTILLVPLLTLAPSLAQNPPAPDTTAPTLKVYSRETIVDVTVTDNKGNPVHGLTERDFSVKEDGKPQAIHSFEEFGTLSGPSAQPLPKLPPNVYTNLQQPSPSSALNILLLDFVNTAPVLAADCCNIGPVCPAGLICDSPGAGPSEVARAIAAQHRVKVAAINYFQHMPRGTRVEVIGMWWPGTLRVLQGFTSDPALLSAAVNTMNYDTNSIVSAGSIDPQYSVGATSNRPNLITQSLNKIVADGSDVTNALIGGTLSEQICFEADGRNRMTLEVLQQIATDLLGVKGKKNLIWFTVGTPYLTDPADRPTCLPDYSVGLTRADSLLMAAQVALYPVDARGIMTLPHDLLTLSGKLILGIPALPGQLHADALAMFAIKTSAEQLSMERWAEKTGGAAFYNTNDLAGALAKAIDKGANYYTLSYIPPGTKYDGRHHAIKITVAESGLHLVYRDGYAAEDPSTFKPVQGLTLANAATVEQPGKVDMRREMTRSMPTSQQVLFDVQVESSNLPAKPGDPAVFGMIEPKVKDKPLTCYGFSYAIPGRQIALMTGTDGKQQDSLEFDLAAYDSDGNVVTSLRQALNLNLNAEQAKQLAHSPFRYFEQLDLPPGQLFLRIGVLDRTSNKVGTLEILLTVPKR